MDKHKWLPFIGLTIFIIVMGLLVMNSLFVSKTNASYSISNHGEKNTTHYRFKHKEIEYTPFTEDELIFLTTEFMNKLVQDIDEQYKVIHFNSKKDLLDDFESIMSRELATQYVDFYYEEEGGSLYIVPTETPPWFNQDKDYDMIQTSDHEVIVTQTNNSVFYGLYEIKLEFSYNEQWKITNITVK